MLRSINYPVGFWDRRVWKDLETATDREQRLRHRRHQLACAPDVRRVCVINYVATPKGRCDGIL